MLKNRDVCSVNDWVFVQSDTANPAVCRIEEIISPLSPDGKTPQHVSTVLVQHAILVGTAEVYQMPRVHLVHDESSLQPLEVCT